MFGTRPIRNKEGKFISGHKMIPGSGFKKGHGVLWKRPDPTIEKTILTTGTKIQSIFGIGDLHYLNAELQGKLQKMINIKPTLKFLTEQSPQDVLIFGGDIWDLDFLSHWNMGQFEDIGHDQIAKLLRQEANDVKNILKQFISAARPRLVYYFIGNHEAWVKAYQQKYQKAFKQTVAELLDFKNLHIIEVPQYESIHIGYLTVVHGEQYRGENPAKLAIMRSHRSVFMFHHHKYIVWPGYSDMDALDKLQSYCLPGMCNVATMEYMRKAPNNWSCGFFQAYIKPSGKFTPRVQVISPKGNFIYHGIEYE